MGNNAQDKTLIGVVGIVIAAAGGGATWLYKRFHYGDDGLNGFGRDRDGFDKDGFDKDGYDFDGLDSNKLDKLGFDKDGYDIDGYSTFAEIKLFKKKLSLFGRYDYMNTDKITEKVKSTQEIIGIAYHIYGRNKVVLDFNRNTKAGKSVGVIELMVELAL